MLNGDEWRNVREILEKALEVDATGRGLFLDRVCAGDPLLRSHVDRLLDSEEKMGDFLLKPAVAIEDMVESLEGQRIGPYRISREIGHGGMGAVYLAERADGEYHKRVAIKLIQTGLGSRAAVERFRNERQVLAELDHPNIARLLDGGTTEDGFPYFVMEFVEGTPIDAWCDERMLDVPNRLKLFCQVCDAIDYAHRKHVVHRDIKPGNVLVSADGAPKLLDFGIAKVLDPELCEHTAKTTAGMALMTPEYASPEQVRAEPVGPASDVYSLGAMLYRLLTGRPMYRIQTEDPIQVARIICESEPAKPSDVAIRAGASASVRGESPESLRRALSGDLDNIVLTALRKEPERRYASAADLSADLRRYLDGVRVRARKEHLWHRGAGFTRRNRTLTAVVATALAMLALLFGWGSLARRAAPTPLRSVAVLPFNNLSGDREQEYFADGVTDALIDGLARIPELRVISRTSAMAFKGTNSTIGDIGRSLGVEYLIEGSVVRSASHARIGVRLIDGVRDRLVWNGSYEGELRDVLTMQRQVAGAIAAHVGVSLAAPNRSQREDRVNLDAYDAYLKGRNQYFTGFTLDSMQKAMDYFQKALELDPGYAPAYAGLADCYFGVSNIYYAPADAMPKVRSAALQAISIDDTLGEAHASLAVVRSLFDFDRIAAEKEFRRAIELSPSKAETHLWYSQHLAGLGRFEEAIAEADLTRQLDPVSAATNTYVGLPLFLAHRYDQVIQRMQPMVDMHPDYHQPHAFLGLAYEQKREWGKAIAEFERAYQLDQEPEAMAQLGHVYAAAGRKADAQRILNRLTEIARTRYVSVYNFALIHAGLGERDESFRLLEQAGKDRSEWFAAINVDPRFELLHSDPRFKELLRIVGLTASGIPSSQRRPISFWPW